MKSNIEMMEVHKDQEVKKIPNWEHPSSNNR